MNQDHLRENISDGLEGLRRKYEICIRGYDRLTLKELSHELRKWTDMRTHVQAYMTANMHGVLFPGYSITKESNRILRDATFVATCFPGGFCTIVDTTQEGTRISLMSSQRQKYDAWRCSIGPQIIPVDTLGPKKLSKLKFTRFTLIYKNISDADSKIIDNGFVKNKLKFETWLTSEALRVGIKDEQTGKCIIKIVSRIDMINRSANILGGSHPIGNDERPNELNEPIKEAMNDKIAGMPVPYYILLKIAYDILIAFKAVKPM